MVRLSFIVTKFQIQYIIQVEARRYRESMTGATAKSQPANSKLDDIQLSRLQTQDYWLQVTRGKLAMDLIFVCEWDACSVNEHP